MKKRTKEEEFAIIACGDMSIIKNAIEEYAFFPEVQMALLLPENNDILKLYLKRRKPCRSCVNAILKGDFDKKVVDAAVMGNVLNEENEILLIKRYPNLVTRYCRTNPAGSYLHDGAYKVAIRNERLAKALQERPHQGAKFKMGEMFSPEMLKKLGYC